MPKALEPILHPVKWTFFDGAELETSIDPETQIHCYTCNQCGKDIKAGKRGKPAAMTTHKRSQECKDSVIKKAQKEARVRMNVCHYISC
jgi:hypothetical protein